MQKLMKRLSTNFLIELKLCLVLDTLAAV